MILCRSVIEPEKEKNFYNEIRLLHGIKTKIFILLYKPNLPNLGKILLKSLCKHRNSIKPSQ